MSKQKLMTKRQKYGVDRYLQGAFGACLFGIEQAVFDYEKVKVEEDSFQHAKTCASVITAFVGQMNETIKLSESIDHACKTFTVDKVSTN